jgi:hypothetical protein
MKKINNFLLIAIILFILSIVFWSYYKIRINQAKEYEEQIMEIRGIFRKQAKNWIRQHEPQIYNNPYDLVAIVSSIFGILSFIGYVDTKNL